MSQGPLATRQFVVPRNFLRPHLLLALAERPSHGYELLAELSRTGMDRVDPGGMYRALRAMEAEALVASSWEPSTEGPARRVYTITAAGRQWLDSWADSVRDLRVALDAILDRLDELTN
ncbi:MAG: PadR family transcriptional regulator [Mycobacteriales bacterium]